jgi:Mg2+ and Co2+ transporters
MITAYYIEPGKRAHYAPFSETPRDGNPVWLDALNPTDEDLDRLSDVTGFAVPTRESMTEIEISSRLYREKDAFVMVASLLPKTAAEILPLKPVAFIFKPTMLVTIRYSEILPFDRMNRRLETTDETRDALSIFCTLLDESISDCADDLELSMRHLEKLTSRLFIRVGTTQKDRPNNPQLEESLQLIGSMGERVANIRESVASLQRLLNFAKTYMPERWLGDRAHILESMRADTMVISDESGFFMNKLSFNLDATLGMINVEETKIIRILSIVTLVLSPPMVVAGIYGMNFSNMPELTWPYGYATALAIIGLTALAPLAYLRRKKWL